MPLLSDFFFFSVQDLESCKLSEVPWAGSGKERFFFDNPQVCRRPAGV
jgi:hypothetical protein